MVFQITTTVEQREYHGRNQVRLTRWIETTKYKLLWVPIFSKERALMVDS